MRAGFYGVETGGRLLGHDVVIVSPVFDGKKNFCLQPRSRFHFASESHFPRATFICAMRQANTRQVSAHFVMWLRMSRVRHVHVMSQDGDSSSCHVSEHSHRGGVHGQAGAEYDMDMLMHYMRNSV